MLKDLKIPRDTAIHCPTIELAKQVLEIFDKYGYTWISNKSYLESNTCWSVHKEKTCYYPGKGTYGTIKYVSPNNFIEATEFLKLHMTSRNISVTLEKAREWYNSSNKTLKEIALQAYTKEELTVPEWQNIKTFEDACKALGIDTTAHISVPYTAGGEITKHLYCIYKLDIIRRALNKGWNPSLVDGCVYYPFVKFYLAGKEAREGAFSNNLSLGKTFKADGKKYTLAGGSCNFYNTGGLANFGCVYGNVRLNIGLLSCKSKEIATHMSRYFSKEIFEATYAQHIGLYEWVD